MGRYKGFLKDCPSGVLDKQEFARIYKQFFPFGDPGQFADFVFNVYVYIYHSADSLNEIFFLPSWILSNRFNYPAKTSIFIVEKN